VSAAARASGAHDWHPQARISASPNHDERPTGQPVELVVLHAISLPPGEYGGEGVEALFANRLDAAAHPYYAQIAHLKVSAHFFIRRDGTLIQCVPVHRRAWHAGVSCWRGRERCNDFSVGIELEGCDEDVFSDAQYDCLARLILWLEARLPLRALAGHEDIAPGRKTDPGPGFDWARLQCALQAQLPAGSRLGRWLAGGALADALWRMQV
jgi:AmpD protein